MLKLLVVGAGGFLGAIARHGLSGLVQRYTSVQFPLGTLVVNLLGCLLIGAVMGFVEDRQSISPNVRLFLVIGLLGSFTTFSTLGNDTYGLLRSGAAVAAVANAAGSVLLGLVAVAIGRACVGLLVR